MNRLARLTAATLGGVAAVGIAAVLIGSSRWNRRTTQMVTQLQTRTTPGVVTTFTPSLLEGLPAPVMRYFRFALQPGQRLLRGARVEHSGTFAIQSEQWQPFTSVQHVHVRPPGFVWNARIGMGGLPPALLSIRVRDSYLEGQGAMNGSIGAVVPVVNQHGTPEMAAGSLARYLAESVWFPTALLPGDAGAGVTWSAIDDSTARATLVDGSVSVSVDFHFGARGDVVRVSGERYRDVDGTGVMTPWEGTLGEYSRRNGMMVPASGEVAWLPPEGRRAYWRGRIADVTYEWR